MCHPDRAASAASGGTCCPHAALECRTTSGSLRLRVRPPQQTRRKSKGADAPLRMTQQEKDLPIGTLKPCLDTCSSKDNLRVLRLDSSVSLHLGRPLQKAPQLFTLAPHEPAELQKPDALHLDSGIGLDPPAQIGATPWRQAVTPTRVPDKTQNIAHRYSQYIGAKSGRILAEIDWLGEKRPTLLRRAGCAP